MSKAKLKKELDNYDAEALRHLILDIYDSGKDVKEYLEYFLNPDVEKLEETFHAAVAKEFRRAKWGTSKARITQIRMLLKKHATFQPGYESMMKMQFQVLVSALATDAYYNFPPTLLSGIAKIMTDFFDYADKNLNTQGALESLDKLLNGKLGSKQTRKYLNSVLNDHMLTLGIERSKK